MLLFLSAYTDRIFRVMCKWHFKLPPLWFGAGYRKIWYLAIFFCPLKKKNNKIKFNFNIKFINSNARTLLNHASCISKLKLLFLQLRCGIIKWVEITEVETEKKFRIVQKQDYDSQKK